MEMQLRAAAFEPHYEVRALQYDPVIANMTTTPDKIEAIQFICSACNKRSVSAVTKGIMKCTHCKEPYIKDSQGEWQSKRYLDASKSVL